MATPEAIAERAHLIATGVLAFDMADWTDFTVPERRTVLALSVYETRDRRRRHNRAAMRLLKTWLTEDQRDDLRRLGWFYVTGSAGGRYRLRPNVAHVEKVEKHGKNWFGKFRYCFHDEDEILPPADVTLAHVLHLLTDEPDFLARANATEQGDLMWNGDWRRRLRAARAAAFQEGLHGQSQATG